MPDSLLPPTWGPAPFDERDLDAVLSGETADLPVALRPVADTIAALRAAGEPAELSGEATIMAEFRALGLGDATRPAGPAPTLQLPVGAANRPRGRAARHRGRRRAAPPVARRVGILMGAAAVIVIAVVFGGNLPGPIQRLAHLGHPSAASASAAHTGGNSASSGLQATGAATVPTHPATSHGAASASQWSSSPSPSSSTPAADSRRLCRTYYAYFTHLRPPLDGWKAELSLFERLSKLAGGPYRVFDYCSQYLGDLFPHGIPQPGQYYPPGMYPGDSGQGGDQSQQGLAQQGQGSTTGSGGAGPATHP